MRLRSHTSVKKSLRLLKSAAAVLISLLGLLLIGVLVQPTQAASEIAVPAKPSAGSASYRLFRCIDLSGLSAVAVETLPNEFGVWCSNVR